MSVGSGAHSHDHTGGRTGSRDLGAGPHRMSCRPAAVPRFRGDFSWNQSPRSELASRGKKGMFFRESIADRLSPAHRGRGFSLKSFSISTAAVGVGTHDLDFPSRMYLPPSAGLSSSAEPKSRRPGLPWCGRKTFRAKCRSVPLSSASWRGGALAITAG